MTSNVTIRTATRDDTHQISVILMLAFAADPFVRWAYPDPDNYMRSSLQYPALAAGPAFDHGSALVTTDLRGAALWLPPGIESGAKDQRETMADLMDPTVRETFSSLIAASGAYCPATPHWHLSLVGVDPALSGRGYGRALVEHGLAVCDRARQPVYLESTNPANLPFYRRLGFDLLAEVQIGGAPKRFPMWRPAQG